MIKFYRSAIKTFKLNEKFSPSTHDPIQVMHNLKYVLRWWHIGTVLGFLRFVENKKKVKNDKKVCSNTGGPHYSRL